MLGRKSYPTPYIAQARTQAEAALDAAPDDPAVCRALVLALDRWFVHRLRGMEPKKDSACRQVRDLAEAVSEGAAPPSLGELRTLAGAYFDEIEAVFAE